MTTKTRMANKNVWVLQDQLTGWFYTGKGLVTGHFADAEVFGDQFSMEVEFNRLHRCYEYDLEQSSKDLIDGHVDSPVTVAAHKRYEQYGDTFGIQPIMFSIPYQEPNDE